LWQVNTGRSKRLVGLFELLTKIAEWLEEAKAIAFHVRLAMRRWLDAAHLNG
jgi:hypothetical protein